MLCLFGIPSQLCSGGSGALENKLCVVKRAFSREQSGWQRGSWGGHVLSTDMDFYFKKAQLSRRPIPGSVSMNQNSFSAVSCPFRNLKRGTAGAGHQNNVEHHCQTRPFLASLACFMAFWFDQDFIGNEGPFWIHIIYIIFLRGRRRDPLLRPKQTIWRWGLEEVDEEMEIRCATWSDCRLNSNRGAGGGRGVQREPSGEGLQEPQGLTRGTAMASIINHLIHVTEGMEGPLYLTSRTN